MRLRRRSSRRKFISVNVFIYFFAFLFLFCCCNNLWLLCRVQSSFCDRHPQRGASLKWQKRRMVLPPNSCCKWAKNLSDFYTSAVTLCMLLREGGFLISHVKTWKHLRQKKWSVLLFQIFSKCLFFVFVFLGHSCRSKYWSVLLVPCWLSSVNVPFERFLYNYG